MSYSFIKLGYLLLAPMRRLWWHTSAYSVILGVIVLTALSITVLYGHNRIRSVFLNWRQRLPLLCEPTLEIPVSIKQRN